MAKYNFKVLAERIISELKQKGVEAYIWHVAGSGSTYIRFEDNRIGSVRLADHKGREHLKYKFNVRTDAATCKGQWVKSGNLWRFFIAPGGVDTLIQMLVDRSKQVQSWEKSKFTYFIPSHKRT